MITYHSERGVSNLSFNLDQLDFLQLVQDLVGSVLFHQEFVPLYSLSINLIKVACLQHFLHDVWCAIS